jgi:hypothetical protein
MRGQISAIGRCPANSRRSKDLFHCMEAAIHLGQATLTGDNAFGLPQHPSRAHQAEPRLQPSLPGSSPRSNIRTTC